MANIFKVEQLTEQSTASATFVDFPGGTLTFTPESTGQIWAVFISGVMRSNSNAEQAAEMRLLINGVEEDLWGHQNNDAGTPNGGGFLTFERITGTVALQTVKLQYRAITGTTFIDNVRVVAARIPPNADFQFAESDGIVSSTGSNLDVGQLQFTPTSAGDYMVFGTIKHREFPSGSTSQAWFEDVGGTPQDLHPNAPAGVHHSNARDTWNPLTVGWMQNLPAAIQTFIWRFTSSLSGGEASEHRYRKFMLFRLDAFDASYSSESFGESTTTLGTFQTKNSLAVPAPPETRDFLTVQTARIGGDNSATAQKSGELRAGGTTLVRTDHRINRDSTATQGYHHIIGVADCVVTDQAITYANGFLSPNGITVTCAESTITVFRYPPDAPQQTHQMML